MVNLVVGAGATFVSFYAPEAELVGPFSKEFPQAKQARSREEVLDDQSLALIATAGIPAERAPLGIEVMRRGKDFLSDKAGFPSLKQLAEPPIFQPQPAR